MQQFCWFPQSVRGHSMYISTSYSSNWMGSRKSKLQSITYCSHILQKWNKIYLFHPRWYFNPYKNH
jgi:hypothetical protein